MTHRRALAMLETPDSADFDAAAVHAETCRRCRARVRGHGVVDLDAAWRRIAAELEPQAHPRPARTSRVPAFAAGFLVALVLGGLALLWAPLPGGREPADDAAPPTGDRFFDHDGLRSWIEADEPGLASLYEPGAHVLHEWADDWSILAGVHEGRICAAYSSPHGGRAGCDGDDSTPWDLPGVFYSLVGVTYMVDEDGLVPYGNGVVMGIAAPDVTRVVVQLTAGPLTLDTFGADLDLGFVGYGASFPADPNGLPESIAAYDAEGRLLGTFSWSVDACGLDRLTDMEFAGNGPRIERISVLIDGTTMGGWVGCGMGVGYHFEGDVARVDG
jgi:hypothetical protein